MISMAHVYAYGVPEVCVIDILCISMVCIIDSSKPVFLLTASMFSTINELNKILTAYD